MNNEQQNNHDSLRESLKAAKSKIGREPLSDDDILALAAESISHSYTYEEKGYGQDLQ